MTTNITKTITTTTTLLVDHKQEEGITILLGCCYYYTNHVQWVLDSHLTYVWWMEKKGIRDRWITAITWFFFSFHFEYMMDDNDDNDDNCIKCNNSTLYSVFLIPVVAYLFFIFDHKCETMAGNNICSVSSPIHPLAVWKLAVTIFWMLQQISKIPKQWITSILDILAVDGNQF